MAKEKMPNIGRKIERIRLLRGIKQDGLAKALGITQAAVSKMEQSEKVGDDKLEEVARALGVTIDAIKNFDEDAIVNNIQNTFYDNAIQNQFNPIEKIERLYERLLESERKRNELLEAQVRDRKKAQ